LGNYLLGKSMDMVQNNRCSYFECKNSEHIYLAGLYFEKNSLEGEAFQGAKLL
jgi:hypothetical protein